MAKSGFQLNFITESPRNGYMAKNGFLSRFLVISDILIYKCIAMNILTDITVYGEICSFPYILYFRAKCTFYSPFAEISGKMRVLDLQQNLRHETVPPEGVRLISIC